MEQSPSPLPTSPSHIDTEPLYLLTSAVSLWFIDVCSGMVVILSNACWGDGGKFPD